eukprot:2157128-Prymnesium_polylepis.1
MCTPRSAPIASAVRSCSCEAVGPTVTAMISVATFFSLSRTASSTAADQGVACCSGVAKHRHTQGRKATGGLASARPKGAHRSHQTDSSTS